MSNVNYAAGETNPNLATVKLSADGKVCLYTLRRAHLIAQMWGHRAICFSAHAAPPAGAPPLKMQAQLVGHLKPAQAKLRPMTQQGRQQQASSGMPRIAVRPKTSLSAR